MKTVWLLISPVLLLMNSAVTNSGAAYVMSLSLHSSTGALTSSKRGSEKRQRHRCRRSPRSARARRAPLRGRPPGSTSPRSSGLLRASVGEPISHSNESVCTSSSPGTSSGSRSLAKEIRFGAPGTELEVLADLLWRETAKMRPSSTSCDDPVPACGRTFRRVSASVRLALSESEPPDSRHTTRSLSRAQARSQCRSKCG